MRLLSALDRFVVQLRADGRSVHTIDQYRRYVRALDGWLRQTRRIRDVRRITAETLAEFLGSPVARTRPDGQPKREVSVNALRSALRTFFAYCHAADYAPRNAAQLIRRARCASPPPRALSESEARRLVTTLKAAHGQLARRDELLFRLLLETGIRLGTALALDVSDVNVATGEITLRRMKGDRPDAVAVPHSLRRALESQLSARHTGPLFSAGARIRLSARQARRRLADWLRRAGVQRHASPHALRHTHAMRLYRRSRDLIAVQRSLHHRSIASAARYASAWINEPRG